MTISISHVPPLTLFMTSKTYSPPNAMSHTHTYITGRGAICWSMGNQPVDTSSIENNSPFPCDCHYPQYGAGPEDHCPTLAR